MPPTRHASRSQAAPFPGEFPGKLQGKLQGELPGPATGPSPDSRSASVFAAVRAGIASRQTRVRILLACVVVMSLVDLDLTLVYASTTGMIEQNPIARQIMSTGSAWLLVAWKLFTVTVAVGLLYHARKHRAGEVGSWLCIGVLCWLTTHWLTYNDELQHMQCAATAEAVRSDPKFVLIETTD